jgi:hypothetical protein
VAINILLTGQIVVSDGTTGMVSLQKQLNSTMIVGSAFSEVQNLSVGVGATPITLPVATVQFVYIKNLHATQSVAVTWTALPGGSNFAITLEPGAIVIILEAAAGGGISALSLQASGASTPVEFILGV